MCHLIVALARISDQASLGSVRNASSLGSFINIYAFLNIYLYNNIYVFDLFDLPLPKKKGYFLNFHQCISTHFPIFWN